MAIDGIDCGSRWILRSTFVSIMSSSLELWTFNSLFVTQVIRYRALKSSLCFTAKKNEAWHRRLVSASISCAVCRVLCEIGSTVVYYSRIGTGLHFSCSQFVCIIRWHSLLFLGLGVSLEFLKSYYYNVVKSLSILWPVLCTVSCPQNNL